MYVILYIMIIIFILILLLAFLLYKNTCMDENYTDAKEIVNQEEIANREEIANQEDLNCYIFGCNSARTNYTTINFIGNDELNNPIFTTNNTFYSVNNDNIIYKITPKIDTITKHENPISIPVFLKDNNLTLKILLNFNEHNFIGYLSNNYYNITYLVYYKKLVESLNFDEMYEYILVQVNNNDEYIINHTLLPRTKINNNENIWIKYGMINLGPYKFIQTLK